MRSGTRAYKLRAVRVEEGDISGVVREYSYDRCSWLSMTQGQELH
jgi:hypothetical protein